MKETGILFTPDNIRAIREGRKTQTRRVVKDQSAEFARCQYGDPGDCLYIKEGIIRHVGIPELIGYYMDGCRATEPWMERKTAMFMPKWAARTWLEIVEVRVERLQDISEEDAKAEGAPEECAVFTDGADYSDHRIGFEHLWDSINRKKHPWSSNPWVWAISFKFSHQPSHLNRSQMAR